MTLIFTGQNPICKRRDHIRCISDLIVIPLLQGVRIHTEWHAQAASISTNRAKRWLRRLRDAGWCEYRRGAWRLTGRGGGCRQSLVQDSFTRTH